MLFSAPIHLDSSFRNSKPPVSTEKKDSLMTSVMLSLTLSNGRRYTITPKYQICRKKNTLTVAKAMLMPRDTTMMRRVRLKKLRKRYERDIHLSLRPPNISLKYCCFLNTSGLRDLIHSIKTVTSRETQRTIIAKAIHRDNALNVPSVSNLLISWMEESSNA